MARMADVPQPSGDDKSYTPYHTKRQTKNGGYNGPTGAGNNEGH